MRERDRQREGESEGQAERGVKREWETGMERESTRE